MTIRPIFSPSKEISKKTCGIGIKQMDSRNTPDDCGKPLFMCTGYVQRVRPQFPQKIFAGKNIMDFNGLVDLWVYFRAVLCHTGFFNLPFCCKARRVHIDVHPTLLVMLVSGGTSSHFTRCSHLSHLSWKPKSLTPQVF